MDPRTQEACAQIAEEVARRRHLAGDERGGETALQIAKFIREDAFRGLKNAPPGATVMPFDENLFRAFQAAREDRATPTQLEVLRHKVWTIFDKRVGRSDDVSLEQLIAMGAWDSVVNAPWFIRSEVSLNDERTLVAALERIAPHRLRKKSGPPKGRALKIRVGGDWTPQLLRSELTRLGLSETRFAKLIGVSQKSVNKWCKNNIPDERQTEITTVINAFEGLKA